MNKNQTEGHIDEASGKVKEIAGKITGNRNLEQKGKIQNVSGHVQAGVGSLQKDIKKASKNV